MMRLIGLALALMGVCGRAWCGPSLEDVIGQMKKAESGIEDIRLEFINEMRLLATGDRQVITGELAMSKDPQRFLVRYTSPVEQLASYDGNVLLIYFPGTGQAVRQKATVDEITRMVGVNPVAPTGLFVKEREPRLVSCGKKSCVLEVKEGKSGEDGKEESSTPATWRLKVNSESWLLEEALMHSEEFEIRIRCHNYRVNDGIKPAELAIALPEGTEVIEGMPQFFRSMDSESGE